LAFQIPIQALDQRWLLFIMRSGHTLPVKEQVFSALIAKISIFNFLFEVHYIISCWGPFPTRFEIATFCTIFMYIEYMIPTMTCYFTSTLLLLLHICIRTYFYQSTLHRVFQIPMWQGLNHSENVIFHPLSRLGQSSHSTRLYIFPEGFTLFHRKRFEPLSILL